MRVRVRVRARVRVGTRGRVRIKVRVRVRVRVGVRARVRVRVEPCAQPERIMAMGERVSMSMLTAVATLGRSATSLAPTLTWPRLGFGLRVGARPGRHGWVLGEGLG